MQSEVLAYLSHSLGRMSKNQTINAIGAKALKVVEANFGHCTFELTISQEHMDPVTNQAATGFLFSVCDLVSSMPVMTSKIPFQRVTSAQIDITYCNPAVLGDRLRITSTALNDNGKLGTGEIKVHRIRDNQLICFGRHVMALLGETRFQPVDSAKTDAELNI